MTSHYEEYKAKIDELKKLGVDKQRGYEVKEYLEKECSPSFSNDPSIDTMSFPAEIVAIQRFVESCPIDDEGLVFPAVGDNGLYPIDFIAALQYDNAAKILDILGAAKGLALQAQGTAHGDEIVLGLLENIFPLLQMHEIVSDCTIEDFKNIILNDDLPCAYCFIRLRMVLGLIPLGGLSKSYVGSILELESFKFASILEEFSKRVSWETDSFDHGVSEERLKADWLSRRAFVVCPRHNRDNIMNTPIKLKLCSHDPFAIMESLDSGMNGILHHPLSANEQWRYADDARNMYVWIQELQGNELFDRAYTSWLEPYRIYLAHLLKKITPRILLRRIGESLIHDINYKRYKCKLPDELKEFDRSELESVIEKTVRKLRNVKLLASGAPNWESVRNAVSQCLATVFDGCRHGFKVEYIGNNRAARCFYIPDLCFFGIYTDELCDHYKWFDKAFCLIKNPPSKPTSWEWRDIKNWVNFASELGKTLDAIDQMSFNRWGAEMYGQKLVFVNLFENSQWHKNTCDILEQKRGEVINYLRDILTYIERQSFPAPAEVKILVLIRNQCESIGEEFSKLVSARFNKLGVGDDKITDPTGWENVLDGVVELNKAHREHEDSLLQHAESETRKKVLLEMSHHIKHLIATIEDPLDLLRSDLEDEGQKMDIDNALAGAELIREIALQAHMSNRGVPGEWRCDWGTSTGIRLESIVEKSLRYAVNEMFHGMYFKRFTMAYFEDSLERYQAAKKAIASASGLDALSSVLEEHFFDCRIEIPEALRVIKVGDVKDTGNKLLVMFDEILLNAVKYSSLVDRKHRFVIIRMAERADGFAFDFINSTISRGVIESPSGIGHIAIRNFAKLFQAEHQAGINEDGDYEVRLDFSL